MTRATAVAFGAFLSALWGFDRGALAADGRPTATASGVTGDSAPSGEVERKRVPPLKPLPPAKLAVITVAIVGDSTVCDYPPERGIVGWGQALPEFLDGDVKVVNMARSGRSSKSFIKEGSWAKVLAARPDYVFIQFGHNDCPGKGDRTTDPASDYQDYLRQYVADARKIGAVPILVTPMSRRRFGPDGTVRTTLRPYAESMIKVARETETPVIDLHAKSVALYERLGDAGSAELNCSPEDRTHFSKKGARAMAGMIVEDLPRAVPGLQPYLRRQSSIGGAGSPASRPSGRGKSSG